MLVLALSGSALSGGSTFTNRTSTNVTATADLKELARLERRLRNAHDATPLPRAYRLLAELEKVDENGYPPLPPQCNVNTGKKCRLANGTMHPLFTVPLGPDEDITDDAAVELLLNWEAHHRQIEIHWTPDSTNNTDWVSLLASKGHLHSQKCHLPPSTDHVSNKSPLVVLGEHRPAKRIAWFFALQRNPSPAYLEMVKSLVISGRMNAPALEPHFLYVMTKSEHSRYVANGGPSADHLATWMINMGVRVVGHVVSFANRKGFALEKASGAQWARLDLFKMAKHMQPEFLKRGLMTSHVLYTDMDIFFSHDLPMPGTGTLRSCGRPYRDPAKPKVLLLCCVVAVLLYLNASNIIIIKVT